MSAYIFIHVNPLYDSLSLQYGSRKIKIRGKDSSTQKSRRIHCILSNIIIILE